MSLLFAYSSEVAYGRGSTEPMRGELPTIETRTAWDGKDAQVRNTFRHKHLLTRQQMTRILYTVFACCSRIGRGEDRGFRCERRAARRRRQLQGSSPSALCLCTVYSSFPPLVFSLGKHALVYSTSVIREHIAHYTNTLLVPVQNYCISDFRCRVWFVLAGSPKASRIVICLQ